MTEISKTTETPTRLVTDNLDKSFQAAKYLLENKLVPSTIKNEKDVVAIIEIGKGIGMDPLTALNGIDMIQGAYAIKSKMIAGILTKNGVALRVIKDYEPIIKKVPVPKKDPEGNVITDENGDIQYHKDPEGKPLYNENAVDYITTVEFIRHFPDVGRVEQEISFKWSDAESAGWINKPNWKKMPK